MMFDPWYYVFKVVFIVIAGFLFYTARELVLLYIASSEISYVLMSSLCVYFALGLLYVMIKL